MKKAGAILLVVVAVLWAATPALACLGHAPTAHACCAQLMRDCDPSEMDASTSCCELRSQNEGEQPGAASFFELRVTFAPIWLLGAVQPVATSTTRLLPATADTSPPRPASDSCILRI